MLKSIANLTGEVIHLFQPEVSVICTVLRQPNGGVALEVSKECNAMGLIPIHPKIFCRQRFAHHSPL